MSPFPSANWSKSFHYGFRDGFRPQSMQELCAAVAAAPRVKALGSGHSFNAIADGEIALDLRGLPLAPVISNDRQSVSVAGRATYGELAVFLDSNGLALHNLASLPHISIAGAIATATHGSGDGNGNLATAVRGLEFVTADGGIVNVSRGEPDFEGMVVHLGALGVVTRVTLDVQPAFEIDQTVYEDMSWQALYDNFDDIMKASYSVSVFTRWRDSAGQVWLKKTGFAPAAPDNLHGARRATVKRHPIIEIDPVHTTDQLGASGLWSHRLPHFKMGFTPSNGDEIQSEYHVPRQHGVAAIKAVADISDSFVHLIQAGEFRTVAADTLWLSPQNRGASLSMHFTWVNDAEAVNAAVKRIEDALAPFDPLPHWGKVFTPSHIGARYPMLERFKAICDKMDPQRKFSNSWLEQVIFGQ